MQKINISVAPMDGITDIALRKTLASGENFIKYTPDIIFTEFINVEALHRDIRSANRAMIKLLTTPNDEKKALSTYKELFEKYNISSSDSDSFLSSFKSAYKGKQMAQLYGKSPKLFAEATSKIIELGYDGVDINMGCPAKKIARRMEGAGLIKTPEIAIEIIDQVKNIINSSNIGKDFTISVKTRLGFETDIAEEWLSLLDKQDLSYITLHGRTFAQGYTGNANWERIGEVRKNLQTKIIGNGDVLSIEDAKEKQSQYDLFGVMIGRNYNAFIKPDRLSRLSALNFYLKNHQSLISGFFRSSDSAYASAKKVIVTFLKFLESKNNLQYNLLCAKSYEEAFKLIDQEISAVCN